MIQARATPKLARVLRPVAASTLACLALAACGAQPGGERPGRGLLVIAVDALRADHVGALGYDRETTAFLDTLAREGRIFGSAWSASPEPLPAHAAILTGCEPMLARRVPLSEPLEGSLLSGWRIPDELPRLPRELLAHGYRTAAFVDHPAVSAVYGFSAGFQEYYGFRSEAVLPDMKPGFEDVVSKFFNWLTRMDASESWFAYVHVNDLERAWRRGDPKTDTFFEPRPELSEVPPVAEAERVFFAVPRARWSGATLSLGEYEARYDGALRELDRNLGRMFEGLRRKGWWGSTTVVVVGTYGVGLGESGLCLSSGTLCDADLRVPVIVRPAPSILPPAASVSPALFSTLDLAPTLLELHGFAPPRGMQGISRAPELAGRAAPAREIAFAAGGLQAGFVAIGPDACLEESSVADAEPGAWSPLTLSWYGDRADHRGEVRTFLHARGPGVPGRAEGHLARGSGERPEIGRLSAAGRDWYEWVEKARAALQRGPEGLAALDPATRAELERRRLLPD